MIDWIFTKVLQFCIILIVILLSPVILYAMIKSEYQYRKNK